MSNPSVPWSAPPLLYDGSAGPLTPSQQRALSLSARVLLPAIVVLAVLTIALGLLRFFLCQFVPRGRGGMSVGVRRSLDSFGTITSVPRGLDASALATLPVTMYHSQADGSGGKVSSSGSPGGSAAARVTSAECAVCLSELADGVMVRALPSCGHAFHVECVDAWLRSRTTCPVCRAEVRPNKGACDARTPAPAPLLGAGDTLVVTVLGSGAQAETATDARTPVAGSGQPAGAARRDDVVR